MENIGVTWRGTRGANPSPPYFFNLGIIYLVTELDKK
jgi:hypothetical protein